MVETNLVGTFTMCREVFSQSMSSTGGAIVNITMVSSVGIPKVYIFVNTYAYIYMYIYI